MANDFSSDSDCIALWRFEFDALSTDSKSTNTLNFANAPAGTTVNYMEGSGAITLLSASSQYAYITDGSLAAGFPLKSGDTSKLISVSCWVRPTTVDANKRRIWSKWSNTGNKRSLQLYHNNSNVYFQYSTAGTSGTEVNLGFGAMTANQWYHITLVVDGVNKTYIATFYNATAGTDNMASGTLSNTLYVSSADWRIGADDDLAANTYFNGQIDEVVVFDRLLNRQEPYAIRGGIFPVTEAWWHIDPINGLNSYTGTTWAQAWKTLQHRYVAGDEIRIAKSTETVLAGTITATNGNEVIQTTNDLTGSVAQYSIVRIGTDDTIYMVWSRTSSTITLHRPYRGSTGSGKAISSVAGFTKTSTSDWIKTSGDGTIANPILLKGGYNTSTSDRDGFTLIEWAGSFNPAFNAYHTCWQFSHIFGSYTASSMWYSSTDCTFNYCGIFRNENYPPFWQLRRCTINNFVGQYFDVDWCYDTIVNDLETGNPNYNAMGIGWALNTTFYRWKNAGWYNAIGSAIDLQSCVIGSLDFIDAVFDELGKGCIHFKVGNYTAIFNNFNFYNPSLGSGILFNTYGLSYNFTGEIGLVNVNGDSTDQRRIIALGSSSPAANLYPTLLQTDTSVYRTSPPSAKITLCQWNVPCKITHYIPCDADIQLTISAYLRKNSSYGSSNLPYMHLSWYDSAPAGLSYCTYDVAMSDTNDTFVQVSHTLTPGVTGTIGLDLVFKSINSGALAWYDDITVV